MGRAPADEVQDRSQGACKWLPEVLAFHREDLITNGRLEGQNNKLGVLKRIAYGFVNADNFGQERCCGALPCHHYRAVWGSFPTKSRGTMLFRPFLSRLLGVGPHRFQFLACRASALPLRVAGVAGPRGDAHF